MILLDTQVVVWVVGNDSRLGTQSRAMIESDTDRRVSAMVSWEIAMLESKGRLGINTAVANWLKASLDSLEAREVPVTSDIARDAGSLGGDIHGDPCDRIMIATARALQCPLVTSDRSILRYAAAGHVRAVDARR